MHGHQFPGDTDGAAMAYSALLDRVLEDRHVDDTEADALMETATKWGLSGDQITLVHHDYLNQLTNATLADGIISDAERRDLQLVARLLGQEKRDLDEILSGVAEKVPEIYPAPATAKPPEENLLGKSVCFTGELQCHHDGQVISRELAGELATRAGLVVVESVTKKLDLLVLADPHTQSGKAKKARQYRIRIMYESVFWKAIGVKVE
jgi:DNA polymerase-3 subunit epsilon